VPEVPTRIGIVGTGAIAQKHIAAIAELPGEVELVAVCDPDEAALERATASTPSVRRFRRLEDLLEAGVIDAGIVATPHFLHFGQANAFARAGVPVLVEKPLVINIEELRALRETAAASGSLVVAGQMHRFDSTNVVARRWLDRNPERFGNLEAFEMHCWQDIMAYAEQVGTSHWLMDGKLAGGGVVVSLAVHQLDIIRYLTGVDYATVAAYGRFSPPFHNGAESSASILVTMSDGSTGTIFASYNAPRAFQSESFTLFGSAGGIGRHERAAGQYLGPLRWASAHDRADVLDFSAIPSDPGHPDAELAKGLLADRFANQLQHFARAVRGEVQPLNTLEQNFNTIACIDAINQSLAAGGTTIDVARA
jgi:predicted dehydrogenase